MKEKNYMPYYTSPYETKPFVWEYSASSLPKYDLPGISDVSITDKKLRQIVKRFGMSSICNKVVQAFRELLEIDLSDVKFITNLSRRMPRAFTKIETEKKSSIDIDNYLTEDLHDFCVLIFFWADVLYQESIAPTEFYEENVTFSQVNNTYFRYLFTKYYAPIKDHHRCEIYTLNYVRNELNKRDTKSILNLAVCCEYCAKHFLVAHECAHIYFQRCQITFQDNNEETAEEQEEFAADRVAFDIINYIIAQEENRENDGEKVMYPYTYQSPIMLLGYYYLYFVISTYLANDGEPLRMIDYVEKRILKLREYISTCQFDYDTSEGNIANDALDNTVYIFLQMFNEYKNNGYLEKIVELIKNG